MLSDQSLAAGSRAATCGPVRNAEPARPPRSAFPLAAAGVRAQLSEVKKPWYASADEHANAVEKYLSGEAVEHWESRDAVVRRITQLKSDFGSLESLALVSHGLLITTWLHSEIGLDDPFSFWSDLRMPDAWEVRVDQKSSREFPDAGPASWGTEAGRMRPAANRDPGIQHRRGLGALGGLGPHAVSFGTYVRP